VSDDDDDFEAHMNNSSLKMGLLNVLEDDLKQKAINHECMICLAKSADAVILQCGHGGICFECGLTICHSKVNPRCHLCRKVRLY
jgi:hypothetical protein